MKFATKAIHCGEEPNLKEGGCGDVVTPIHLSATFVRKEIYKPTGGYEYARTDNPTRNALEKRLAVLENSKYGLAFASGLAAETLCLLLCSKVEIMWWLLKISMGEHADCSTRVSQFRFRIQLCRCFRC